MHVKNIYPTTTTNEDLIGLAEMASTYLSSMPAALATNEILATERVIRRTKGER